ncbi:hypothetical protein LZC95_33375 [Pendulispora brunnea]|uniref:Uncharacterized protein n=1 Tax=Pendulispora brunnea TaxID=2905690 RepID=A0ABZ2JXW8_9BACT
MSALGLKLLLVPLLLVLVSWTARRYGPRVSGIVTGLPVVSGPISLFLAVGNGARFASGAAPGALAGLGGVGAFCGAYAWASRRATWPRALACGLGGFLVAAVLLQHVSATLGALSLAALGMLIAVRWMLAFRSEEDAEVAIVPPAAHWELPARIALATGIVVGLTSAAERLGPSSSGVFSTLPVLSAVVAVFTHARGGGQAVRTFLTGVVGSSIGTVGFFAIVGAMLTPGALLTTYAMAVLATALINVISR